MNCSQASSTRERGRGAWLVAFGVTGVLWLGLPGVDPGVPLGPAEVEAGACPANMVSVRDRFCVDRFEASLVEIKSDRKGKAVPDALRKHSPFKMVAGKSVLAVSAKNRTPQGYISRNEAEQACINAGKRLCSDAEWLEACRGKRPTLYPYGEDHQLGFCNDKGVSSFNLLFGPGNNQPPIQSAYTNENMNDARLNEMDGTVAKTGTFKKCKNSFGLFDMVGNLHEWTSAGGGTFRGGYYLDTHINGQGCDYKTTVHGPKYHDYSTGFRCCQGGKEQRRIESELVAQSKKESSERTAKKAADKKAADKRAADKKAADKKKASKPPETQKAKKKSKSAKKSTKS